MISSEDAAFLACQPWRVVFLLPGEVKTGRLGRPEYGAGALGGLFPAGYLAAVLVEVLVVGPFI
jgi:hypothetical protein